MITMATVRMKYIHIGSSGPAHMAALSWIFAGAALILPPIADGGSQAEGSCASQEQAVTGAARRAGMAEAGRDDGGPGVIRSAFGLLELLRVLGRARLADLTRESGLPRTTVHRLMGQPADVRAVERIDGHYKLGPDLLTLGRHVTPLERLRAVAQRPLIELAAATPAHVGLSAMAATGPIYLDVFVGRGRLLPSRAG